MNDRDYGERQGLRSDRAAAGYTSARLSRSTLAKLHELLRAVGPAQVYGLDELLYELAEHELQRRQLVARIRAEAAVSRPHG